MNIKWCETCKVGKETYELDLKSVMCPYIDCYKKEGCKAYVMLDNKTNKRI